MLYDANVNRAMQSCHERRSVAEMVRRKTFICLQTKVSRVAFEILGKAFLISSMQEDKTIQLNWPLFHNECGHKAQHGGSPSGFNQLSERASIPV